MINSSNYKSLINDDSAIQVGSVKSVLKCLHSNHPQQIIWTSILLEKIWHNETNATGWQIFLWLQKQN